MKAFFRDGDGVCDEAGAAGSSDCGTIRTSRPSETVPEEVLELWTSLPRRKRQRRRRGYFLDQAVCCSHLFSTKKLSNVDARVKILEDALAEFVHATVASIPTPPARSCEKRDREDAEPPSSPAPVNTVGRTLSGIPPAAEPARNAVSLSPTASNSTSAAVVCASSQSTAPPVLDGWPRHDSGTLSSGFETLVEQGSPSSPASPATSASTSAAVPCASSPSLVRACLADGLLRLRFPPPATSDSTSAAVPCASASPSLVRACSADWLLQLWSPPALSPAPPHPTR